MIEVPADISIVELAQHILGSRWWQRTGMSETDDVTNAQRLCEVLAFRIDDLLQRDMARLSQIFYHADVAERAVDRVFENARASEVAQELAGLLIEREIARMRHRREFDPVS